MKTKLLKLLTLENDINKAYVDFAIFSLSLWSIKEIILFQLIKVGTTTNYKLLSRLRQFLATESPLKMIKNAFYLTLKALFVLKITKFLSWLFAHVEKRFD